jgi:hypothetical protein
MPWLETAPMEERLRFVEEARHGRWTMVDDGGAL